MIGLFSSDPELIDIGARGMKRALTFMPIIGFQIVALHISRLLKT